MAHLVPRPRPATPARPAEDSIRTRATPGRREICRRAGTPRARRTPPTPPFHGSASPRTADLRSQGTREKPRGSAKSRDPAADRPGGAAAEGRPRDSRPGAPERGGRPRHRPLPAEPQSRRPRAAHSQKQHPTREKGRCTALRKQPGTVGTRSSPDPGLGKPRTPRPLEPRQAGLVAARARNKGPACNLPRRACVPSGWSYERATPTPRYRTPQTPCLRAAAASRSLAARRTVCKDCGESHTRRTKPGNQGHVFHSRGQFLGPPPKYFLCGK